MQHLHGQAAAEQQGAVGQALMRILGATASTSTVSASTDPASNSSSTGHQHSSRDASEVVPTAADSGGDGSVQSPVSLADGMVGTHGEPDAKRAHALCSNGSARDEPDACILFRPAAGQLQSEECSWIPARHASTENVGQDSAAAVLAEPNYKPAAEPVSSRPVRQETSAKVSAVPAAGSRQRVFSPVEAVRGFSQLQSHAAMRPGQAARSSQSATPGAAAPVQSAQRYSAVHAVTTRPAGSSRAKRSLQHTKEAQAASAHQALGMSDTGHFISLSSEFMQPRSAAMLGRHARLQPGKENDWPVSLAGPVSGSAGKAHDQRMGSPYLVQDNPLSAMEPSPEVCPQITISGT